MGSRPREFYTRLVVECVVVCHEKGGKMNITNSVKNCPLCGNSPEILHGMLVDYCTCKNESCQLYGMTIVFKDWQSRPREDELESRITELSEWNAMIVKTSDEILTKNKEYARYITDEQVEQMAVKIAETKNIELWTKAYLALQELPKLREKLAKKDEYALRLLCESTRVWVCENCGEEFSMKYKGDWVIDGTPIARMDCPQCDSQNSCELKSAVLERKISELEEIRSSWEFVARKITSIANHEIPFSAANAELIERIELIDQILFEVTGKK